MGYIKKNMINRRSSFDVIKTMVFAVLGVILFGIAVAIITGITFRLGNKVGKVVDTYENIPIYNNGTEILKYYGINKSKDGYVYGDKWQCVEFVNRFYYDKLGVAIPGGGNAKDYFNSSVENGNINSTRMLTQFKNGEGDKPKVNDIIVFTNGDYGHVAIVSKVEEDYIEIVQQNVYNKPREKLSITYKDSKPVVGSGRGVSGWLRKEK